MAKAEISIRSKEIYEHLIFSKTSGRPSSGNFTHYDMIYKWTHLGSSLQY